jgi:hypothetical protein
VQAWAGKAPPARAKSRQKPYRITPIGHAPGQNTNEMPGGAREKITLSLTQRYAGSLQISTMLLDGAAQA